MDGLLKQLENISLEDIQKKINDADDIFSFQILLLCKSLKEVLEKKPQTYKEVLEQDFYLNLFYSALKVWVEASEELKGPETYP